MQMFQNLFRTMKGSDQLKVHCEPCRRLISWTYAEAVAHCGPDATPMDVRARVRCTACGRRGQAQVWI
jgi:hypothetical protein